MKAYRWLGFAFAGSVAAGMAGCGDGPVDSGLSVGGSAGASSTTGGSNGTGGSGGSTTANGVGVGEACGETVLCRTGLACNDDGVCEPGHSQMLGDPCTIGPECADELQCVLGSCVPAGENDVGESCNTDGDCLSGLRCSIVGFSAQCLPAGMGDIGAECETSLDCFGGLFCAEDVCAPGSPDAPFGGSLWTGVECEGPSDDVKAYFEVPGADGADEGDFFRLPFPNDARLNDGKLDLEGFPTPGPALLGFDLIADYVAAVEKNDHGFGGYGGVMFRFSGELDLDSLRESGAIEFVDVTADSPDFGNGVGYGMYYAQGRTPYVCDNWVDVRPPEGSPLRPGHTYAVFITSIAKTADGGNIGRPNNLVSLLASSEPDDATLAEIYPRYASFRQYLEDEFIDPATVVTASVFTVGGLQDPMTEVADAANALPAPTSKDWVKCADGVESPCSDAEGDRACGEGTADYDEYQALVSLPIYQTGEAPYVNPEDGGEIEVTDDPPREDVCLSISVPKGTAMPAEGWPIVVFAHGTGGSYRSHLRDEVAGVLARSTPAFAVLGIDQVVHGPRRNGSTISPDDLFFNFLNPAAARGNPIQGAVDQISLGKFAAALDLAPEDTGGDAIKGNPDQVFFFGHSQGSTEGSLAVPFSDVYKAAVLSGNGASLMDALLHKTSPVDITQVLPFALSDPSVHDTQHHHPVLGLLQQWIDPADPLNFAAAITRRPIDTHLPKHVFQTFGLGDTYSPPETLRVYALAGSLIHVNPVLDELDLATADAPLTANVSTGAGDFTLGVRQYEPADGDDGHFVVFDVGDANDDMVHFFVSATAGAPEIGQ